MDKTCKTKHLGEKKVDNKNKNSYKKPIVSSIRITPDHKVNAPTGNFGGQSC